MVNGTFKAKRLYFSQVSNTALRDPSLSLKAKGLYALIQSYITIENFILYKTTLKNKCKEGLEAFEGTWKELKEQGYLLQEKTRANTGAYRYEYELLDNPVHPPKTQGVDNPPCGKVGGYKKTEINNTEPTNTDNKNNNGAKPDGPCTNIKKDVDVERAIGRYYELYQQNVGETHPHLITKQLDAIYTKLHDFMEEHCIDGEAMEDMMSTFFDKRNMNTDYNINHFATNGIMLNCMYETIGNS